MTFPVTRRLMRQIDELLTLKAIQHVYKELTGRDPEVPATRTKAWLEDLCRQLSHLLPSEDERLRRLREAADAALPQAVEDKVQQLTDAEVAEVQFEAGDIARLCFSGRKPPKGINPTVHGMVLQQLMKTGRLRKPLSDSNNAAGSKLAELMKTGRFFKLE